MADTELEKQEARLKKIKTDAETKIEEAEDKFGDLKKKFREYKADQRGVDVGGMALASTIQAPLSAFAIDPLGAKMGKWAPLADGLVFLLAGGTGYAAGGSENAGMRVLASTTTQMAAISLYRVQYGFYQRAKQNRQNVLAMQTQLAAAQQQLAQQPAPQQGGQPSQ